MTLTERLSDPVYKLLVYAGIILGIFLYVFPISYLGFWIGGL